MRVNKMARNTDNDNDERLAAVNVQCLLEQDYYDRLVRRGEANDRSARREATRILKAVLDGNIQFVDPVPVQVPASVGGTV